jgi:hypothetical protein
MSRWETIGIYKVEPRVEGGISWGGTEIHQRFVLEREYPKKAKGWRRHARRAKAQREGDRIRPLKLKGLS